MHCAVCAGVIEDAKQKMSDEGSVSGAGQGRRQRSVLQAMLEARDDDGNPVRFIKAPLNVSSDCLMMAEKHPCCTCRL